MRISFAPEDVLDLSVEMEDLAAAYMAQKAVPAAFADDAQHVAVCAVARFDYLVSWRRETEAPHVRTSAPVNRST